ncbi:alpha/beta hydrolase [Amycolatopsis mongoliensis]|uniref:Alpha/beta hydrolase n=1 Tax=Amycolatopsis mongoliensis TaxID=715475 RepID=A0A9Y2JI38_9PSEU|nr:alpha/beta hydrolase [Amycolatopsis sp. 4-36]WIX98477.1 alpha/beta hydrolase [Amycolatopsis sp. 4-36]
MTELAHQAAEPMGPGSVREAPGLPEGFSDTFRSRWVRAGTLRLHAVTGGDGPPLLLIPGWPQTWYAWRHLMPTLARDFTVVAPDPRGVGLSAKPREGYDTGTLADDMVKLMDALGHRRFAVAGHDVGMWTGYAMAADHPARVERLAVAEAVIPGLTPSPPLHMPQEAMNRLWHFGFNRLGALNEHLVEGRERLFFGHQFTAKAARPLPEQAIDHYVDVLASDREALRASFEFYRALDTTIAQNGRRREHRLRMPVLAVAGELSTANVVADTMALVADDLVSVVIPGCGHFPAEEAPDEMLAALAAFLAGYR